MSQGSASSFQLDHCANKVTVVEEEEASGISLDKGEKGNRI